jgi:hypothetical protein
VPFRGLSSRCPYPIGDGAVLHQRRKEALKVQESSEPAGFSFTGRRGWGTLRKSQNLRRLYMKQALRLAVAALCFSLLSLATAAAQDQYTEGTVERVTLLHILPGHFNAFMADVKNNIKPIWDAEKSAGLIEGYQVFFNQTKASIDDWDIGISLTYKNMAALDGLGMKVLDLRMKQYGDKSKEQQVIDKRVENGRQVASYLIRNVTMK